MNKKEKANKVVGVLDGIYPEATCSLDFENPLQLLIATQLAAQCTDERVNKVTPKLFERYKTAEEYAEADIEELEALIRSTGFYRNKARNIKECCRQIVDRYEGKVPKDMKSLLMLAGVGRKTANVVLGECFDVPGMVVDTHVGRLSKRIGLTKHKDPKKIELDLMELLTDEKWRRFGHLLIAHGREICKSRSPACHNCVIANICDFNLNKK